MGHDEHQPADAPESANGLATGEAGPVKELRLALVCYGGVSLAVYMHGLTQELYRLVLASSPKPGLTGTAKIYKEILGEVEEEDGDGVPTRVVIDIISGTSAGGINGVSLARALAKDGDLSPIRELWMDHADIEKLLEPGWPKLAFESWPLGSHLPGLGRWLGHPPSVPPEHRQGILERLHDRLRKVAEPAINLAHLHKVPSVLRGDQLSGYIDQGLRTIATASSDTLVRADNELHLFVTMTDLAGYVQHVPLANGYVSERGFRNRVDFAYIPGKPGAEPSEDDFADDCVHLLAFCGRASSSFPGAFQPVSLDSFAKDIAEKGSQRVRWADGQLARFFRAYILRWAETANRTRQEADLASAIVKRRFVDGGVLDNYPFDHAIEAIRARRADHEVRRRVLLYLEPDPMKQVADETEPGPTPSILSALKAAGSDIPLSQPILDQLRRVGELNDAALRLRTIIAEAPPEPPAAVDDAAAPEDPSAAPYLRLRLDGVGDGIANVICRARRFPPASNQHVATHEIVATWIRNEHKDAAEPAIRTFLAQYDVGFQRRRLRFIIDGVIAAYGTLQGQESPTRSDLDALKAQLYDRVDVLDGAAHVDEGSPLDALLANTFNDLLSRTILGPPYTAPGAAPPPPVPDQIATWLTDHPLGELLKGAQDALMESIGAASIEAYGDSVVASVKAAVATWTNAEAAAVVTPRLGSFERWDRTLYPIRRAYDVGEHDVIELARMSPLDARLLAPAGDATTFYAGKIKGAAYNHFGAFFERSWRENDYLWGRLDAAERLLRLLLEGRTDDQIKGRAAELFKAICEEELTNLHSIDDTFDLVAKRIASMSGAAPPS